MKNKMSDLRNHLFDVLERLKDPDEATPMSFEQAKAIVAVSEQLIDSARVENEYLHQVNRLYPDGIPTGGLLQLPGWSSESVDTGR